MATLNLDLTNVERQEAFDPLPNGWYPAMITESAVGSTKANDGSTKLDLTFVIIDGQYKGRKIFNTLNIGNMNPVAKEIAMKQLSSIAHAVGVLNVQQSEWLHEKPLMIRLKVRQATADYDASNDVSGYKAYAADAGVPAGAPAAPAAIPAFIPPATLQQAAAPLVAPVAAPVFQPPAQQAAPVFQQPAPAAPVVAPPGWTQDAMGNWLPPTAAAVPVAPAGLPPQQWEQPGAAAAPAAVPAAGAVPAWAGGQPAQ